MTDAIKRPAHTSYPREGSEHDETHARKTIGTAFLAMTLLGSFPAGAADDPAIQGDLRKKIQTAMREFIAAKTVTSIFPSAKSAQLT